MAKAKRKSLGAQIASLIVIILLVALILCAVLELFVAPKHSNIESKYENRKDVSVSTSTGTLLGVNVPGAEAASLLFLGYGYSNSAITDDITAFTTISCYKEKDGEKTYYSAYVIYFDSMKDANTVREAIQSKVKENDDKIMIRGKTLVFGDQDAVLKYYAVLF